MKKNNLRRRFFLLPAVILLICAIGCSHKDDRCSEYSGFLFDTIVNIKVWYDGDSETILAGAEELCIRYDRLFDRHNPDSDIWRINHSEGAPCTVEPETAELISEALDYARLSGGKFDITCGRVTALWDFSSPSPSLPDPEQLKDAVSSVGWQAVELDDCTVSLPAGTELDFGGIAKGYIADRVAEYLEACGVEDAVINLGGNVRVIGDKDGQLFSVGIQSPFDPSGYAGILKVSDCSVVTAGSYQRFFELEKARYHHIIDLSDGMPANTGLTSVSVVADSSVQADALATICFLMGTDDGMKLISSINGAEAVFITEDNQVLVTDGLSDKFFPY